jgi:hypothetical protein
VAGGDDQDFTAVADAMARALTRSVAEIGDRVWSELTTVVAAGAETTGAAGGSAPAR